MTKEFNSFVKLCECGIYISGGNKQNAESNLEQHKKSKLHKRQLKNKKIIKLVGKDLK